MRKIEKCDPERYPVLVGIWERAVRATHDFLSEKDIQEIKAELIPGYFPQVEVFVLEDDRYGNVGFIGILGSKIEMLFVDTPYHGHGYGTKLIEFAISNGAAAVDVNEQNPLAADFYMKRGFRIISRDETDDAGRPFPILHMALDSHAL